MTQAECAKLAGIAPIKLSNGAGTDAAWKLAGNSCSPLILFESVINVMYRHCPGEIVWKGDDLSCEAGMDD